jgi:hypothetical protein
LVTLALLMAIALAGLFASVIAQHELGALTTAVADHERRLLRLEMVAPPARSRAWLSPPQDEEI